MEKNNLEAKKNIMKKNVDAYCDKLIDMVKKSKH